MPAVTASARSAPERMLESSGAMKSTDKSKLPLRVAMITSPVVLCGTTTASMPAVERNNSAARCCVPPGVMLPRLSLPGLALAMAMNSFSVFAFDSGPVTSTMLK